MTDEQRKKAIEEFLKGRVRKGVSVPTSSVSYQDTVIVRLTPSVKSKQEDSQTAISNEQK